MFRISRPVVLIARLLLALAAGCAQPARAVTESDLKAAIVYNILLFVEWPAVVVPPASAGMVLCLRPDSPLAPALRTLVATPLRGQPIAVRDWSDPRAPRECQVIVLDGAQASIPARVRALAPDAPVLTVADEDMGDAPRATVRLRRVGSRIAFDIDLALARQGGLTLSSKLLRLATAVRE